jgi:hypothetical protein
LMLIFMLINLVFLLCVGIFLCAFILYIIREHIFDIYNTNPN